MEIYVNGQARRIETPCSVANLLRTFDFDRERNPRRGSGIAVAVNQQVIPRGEHERIFLSEHDRVEIIHPVGGG